MKTSSLRSRRLEAFRIQLLLFACRASRSLQVAPSFLAGWSFQYVFLWLVEICVKGWVLKLELVEVIIRLVRDIVGNMRFISIEK